MICKSNESIPSITDIYITNFINSYIVSSYFFTYFLNDLNYCGIYFNMSTNVESYYYNLSGSSASPITFIIHLFFTGL